jgi:hypothetical protein
MQSEQPPLANVGELLETMTVRLQMQRQGLTNPRKSVCAATELLVERLANVSPTELVEVRSYPSVVARYVRVITGEVLAEIPEHDA